MSIGSTIREAREKRGLSQQELADRMGVSKPAVSKWENDGSLPETKRLPLLAQILELSPGDLLFFAGHGAATPPADAPPPPTEVAPAPDAPPLPYRSEMPKDVPLYGTVVGGTAQGNLFDFELNGTVVDYVRRPPRITGRADVFAVYVSGSSMAPWREPGQLVYVEAAKPPKRLDYVLVEFKPPEGHVVRPALVKRFLAITPTKLRLRQFQPAKDFEVDRQTVLRVFRVMDWDELMGV